MVKVICKVIDDTARMCSSIDEMKKNLLYEYCHAGNDSDVKDVYMSVYLLLCEVKKRGD